MIIQAENIEKSFGSLKVLKGVDFSASQGEVVSIMGASGAGKSTLLQILGTLSTPDAGRLVIDGSDVLALGSKELSAFRNLRLGFVFQCHHLLPEFTSLENVMIPALIAGKPAAQARSEARELLGMMGLAEREGHKPSELSGGEQQRVAIARAIAHRPDVIFADEPTAELDSQTAKHVMRLFLELSEKEGITIVMTTHDRELMSMGSTIYELSDGKLI